METPSVLCNDIGHMINATMTVTVQEIHVVNIFHSATLAQKYHLLTEHFRPTDDYVFPARALHQFMREFKHRYLKDCSWMVYSPTLDGAFCIYCALSVLDDILRASKGAFVNKPFLKFHKLDEKAKAHQSTE